ncbi:SprT-like family-domain-containing protein [Bisporella sp. PMI_857]|nr:SprT-like family-domain-containing protein [Bisporella sp. PMI_857]
MVKLVVEDSDDELPDVKDLLPPTMAVEKAREIKGKKRVLKQRADNPLLRKIVVEKEEGEGKRRARTRGRRFEKVEEIRDSQEGANEVGSGEERVDMDMEPEVNSVPARDTVKMLDVTSRHALALAKASRGNSGGEPGETVLRKDRPMLSSKTSKTASKAVRAKPKLVERSIDDSEEDVLERWNDESDDMSDFIVNDSEVEILETPPQRTSRKLVRGRRPVKEKGDLERLMEELNVEDDASDLLEERARVNGRGKDKESRLSRDKRDPIREAVLEEEYNINKQPPKLKHPSQSSIDIDDPFTLKFSPSENRPRKASKETRFSTPPGSPILKPKGLQSPKKIPRIPSTPHPQSMDDFWSQDVINDWNDEYSPRKIPKSPVKTLFSKNVSAPNGLILSPKKTTVKPDRIAKDVKKAFEQQKHTIAESFLLELDSTITNGQIAKLAECTGGVKLVWSKKLNTTAGRANWKRETIRSTTLVGPNGKPMNTYRHYASIELAEKVIDDEDRLLNVIAHEFCHLANFMISNIKTNPHGKEFKAWAVKVSRHFGDRGIEVTTKHSYTIDYKYIWQCTSCALEFKRHSKSIDPARHQCGSCKSKLAQVKPVPRATGVGKTEYQVFMKEQMAVVRRENPGSPQKEILGLVGKKYQEYKAGKTSGKSEESAEIMEHGVGSKESTPEEDGLDVVSRKLDFLDLTSP